METKSKNQKETAPQMENRKFREFFVDQLKDIYWAEQALYKALPKMMKAATSKKLASAFEKHTKETEGQIRMLEQVFELMGEKAKAKKCEAMDGLIKEAEAIIEDTDKDSYTRDAGLVLAGQKTEHYEIASYGTLVEFAKQMGETKVAELLQKILDQEKNTDISLTMVAEGQVNEEAVKE
ncbi:YciE/YciF ferroxidase family protein [Odoribacter laneus]